MVEIKLDDYNTSKTYQDCHFLSILLVVVVVVFFFLSYLWRNWCETGKIDKFA